MTRSKEEMATVRFGVREAKNNMSQLLRMVQDGREVEITRRSKVVARIIPANCDHPAS